MNHVSIDQICVWNGVLGSIDNEVCEKIAVGMLEALRRDFMSAISS